MIQNTYQERPDSPTDEAHAARKAERAVSNKKESVCQVSVHMHYDHIWQVSVIVSCKNVFIIFFLLYIQVCEKTSEDLVTCEGQCHGSYHLQCLGLDQSSDKVLCTACRTGKRDITKMPSELCFKLRLNHMSLGKAGKLNC